MDNDVETTNAAVNNSTVPTTTPFPESSMPKKTSTIIIASLALIAAISAGIIAGVNWKKRVVEQKQLLYVMQHLRQQQQLTGNMSQQLTSLVATVQKQQMELTQANSEIQRLTAQDPNYINKQTLQEIEHIIREAILNLSASHNIPATISLLQAADQRAQRLSVSGIQQLRELFAKNITALQMITPLDVEGVISKLAALQTQIEQIPLFVAPVLATSHEQPTQVANKGLQNWRQGLQETWESLQKIIIIRHRNEPVVPLLPPDQYHYLKQNLQLLLQQAIWGVMQRQDKVYQNSLQQAITWIQKYYTSNQSASRVLLSNLQALQKTELQPQLPDLMPLLQQVQQMHVGTEKNTNSATSENSAAGLKPVRQVGAL